jgi:hypothetical protein
LDDEIPLKPGSLVKHRYHGDHLGVVIRCYTKSHRPMGDEYEVFWGRKPIWTSINPTIETKEVLIVVSDTFD